MTTFLTVVIAATTMLSVERAFACIAEQPLTDELKTKAEFIFVGEAIKYTPPIFDPTGRTSRPAVIQFKVQKIILGAKQSQIEAYWINGTFGESRSLEDFKNAYGNQTRVGIKGRGPLDAKPFHDKPWVVQGPCTTPYMWAEKYAIN